MLWKQERFVVLRPLQIEFFRTLLGRSHATYQELNSTRAGSCDLIAVFRAIEPKRIYWNRQVLAKCPLSDLPGTWRSLR